MSGSRTIAIGLGAALSVHSGQAKACSCSFDAMTFPPGGATGVPLNIQIRSLDLDPKYSGKEPAVLVGPRGVVATDLRHMEIESTWYGLPVLRPLLPLEPDTEYRVEGLSWGNDPYTFTTGSDVDREPPPAPTVVSVDWADSGDASYECVGGPRFQFSLNDPRWLSLYIATPRNGSVSPDVSGVRQISWYGRGSVGVGLGVLCQAQWYEPGYHDVYVANMDGSGNLSAWTQIPGALNWDAPALSELVTKLPVQDNAPKFLAKPRFRGQRGHGCSVRSEDRQKSNKGAATWGLLALLLGGLVTRRVRAR